MTLRLKSMPQFYFMKINSLLKKFHFYFDQRITKLKVINYCIAISIRKNMVQFTFDGLFMTTNKGIPDITNLPTSTTLALPFYFYSLILQIILFLIFLLYFVLTIYRVVKKIKNSKFLDVPDQDKREEDNQKMQKDGKAQKDGEKEGQNQKDDNLIYRFDDEEDEEDQKKQEKEGQQDTKDKQSQAEAKQQNYQDYHDQNEEAFIALDGQLLFLQPFLIVFIICNSVFAADAITLVMVLLMLFSYFMFNIKGKMSHIRITPLLFLLFAILGFMSFFINDHDLTT